MRKLGVVFVLVAAVMAGIASTSTPASAGSGTPCDYINDYTAKLDAPGVLNGTAGDDILIGSPGADVINGKGGNDIICGNGGADVIDGGTGNDRIEATDGSTIYGGIGNDEILASGGSVAYGGAGNDQFVLFDAAAAYGESGNDAIDVISGVPSIDCGSGIDNLLDLRVNGNELAPLIGVKCETRYL